MAGIAKREAVAAAYHSVEWKEKVKKMTDAQVFAIYMRLVNQKKI